MTFLAANRAAAQSGSIIFVTTVEPGIHGDGLCSLQEAIYSANLHNNVAVDSINSDGSDHLVTTGCMPGTGNDTIVLPSASVLQLTSITLDAHNPYGPTATPIITSNIIIESNGAILEHLGTVNFRAFAVGVGGNLTIRNAYIKGFIVKGGNGTAGGGGGLGAGGAIYVQAGSLTVENSTFSGNGAVGGNGSAINSGAGGGGGGMSGNGGQPVEGKPNVSGGGGGGSRGAGGNGGGGPSGNGGILAGGGGGTVTIGFSPDISGLTDGGFNCGGNGGTIDVSFGDHDGHSGFCPGGGGGGGSGDSDVLVAGFSVAGNGGEGNYGAGGGGGGYADGNGGAGGFGGGGGSSSFFPGSSSGNGGNGGFGGGGGGGQGGITGGPGQGGVVQLTVNGNLVAVPGFFGGGGDRPFGGGGGALGGVIFNHGGVVMITNSTFTANFVTRGLGSGGTSDSGQDAGGAIFSLDGSLTVLYSTISGNQSTGADGGITVFSLGISAPVAAPTFVLHNTIVAGNGANECRFSSLNSVTPVGSGNLIQSDASCPGVVATADPQLGPLQDNSGFTPTMAIRENTPAWNAADAGTPIAQDQRGQDRPELGGYDIGAFELCQDRFGDPCLILAGDEQTEPLTVQVSLPAGGSTTPGAGTVNEPLGSVTILNATANPGFSFQNWTGNVANPSSASTTIIMNTQQSVVANFVACACATDVSRSIGVIGSGFVLNIGTGRFAQTVTLTNNSALTITGPFSLVLDGLSANAALSNATGTTSTLFPPAGSPYINVNATLVPGQKIAIALQFNDPTRTAITYTTRVLAGPGSR